METTNSTIVVAKPYGVTNDITHAHMVGSCRLSVWVWIQREKDRCVRALEKEKRKVRMDLAITLGTIQEYFPLLQTGRGISIYIHPPISRKSCSNVASLVSKTVFKTRALFSCILWHCYERAYIKENMHKITMVLVVNQLIIL